jgi:hypothetical protein
LNVGLLRGLRIVAKRPACAKFSQNAKLTSDKLAIFGQSFFPTDSHRPMADSNEPKEETVRIELPRQSVSKPPGPDTKSRETVRIQLGRRQQSDSPQGVHPVADKLPLRIPIEPSPVLEPDAQVLTSPEVFPPPPAPPPLSTNPSPAAQASMPVTTLSDELSSGPKKETARIALMPDLPSEPLPRVQMKKTQPLIAMPHAAPQIASIAVAPAEKGSMPLCWVLLGVSAIILIIQIWTYLS